LPPLEPLLGPLSPPPLPLSPAAAPPPPPPPEEEPWSPPPFVTAATLDLSMALLLADNAAAWVLMYALSLESALDSSKSWMLSLSEEVEDWWEAVEA